MIRLFIVGLLVFMVSGCIGTVADFAVLVNEKAVKAADAHYAVTKIAYCNTQSSGALGRNVYGTDEWNKFKALCWSGKEPFPTIPEPSSAPDS